LEPTRPIALSAVIAAGWVAIAGIVAASALAVAAWFAADGGSFAGAMRVGGLGWLVAHGAGVHAAGSDVTAIPVGGVLVAGLLLYRAGRWAGESSAGGSARDAALGAAVMSAVYAATGLLVTALTHRQDSHVDLWRTALAFSSIALVFGGLGLLRGTGAGAELWSPVPAEVCCVLEGAAAAFLVLSGLSALAFAASMTVHFSAGLTIADGLGSGLVGGVILTLIGVGLVPNAALCAGAFMAGPGFAVGGGTAVSSAGVQLGPLPAVPILAATPRSGGAWWQEALIAAPLVAGVVAGVLTLRRSGLQSYPWLAGLSAAAGALGGAAFGLAGLLATGSVGPGRMAQFGPDVPRTTLVCGVAGLLAAATAAVAVAWATELAGHLRRARATATAPATAAGTATPTPTSESE
jgi:hypothetical protein